MLQTIIPYLNVYLTASTYFEKNFGLIEIVKNAKGKEGPKEYCNNGEWKEVSNFDNFNGISYWRKNGDVTNEDFNIDISCDKFLRINIPLKLICAIPKKKTSKDDAYTPDRIINDLTKLLIHSSGSLKTSLKAMRVNVHVPSYKTSSQEIFDSEYKNVSAKGINFKWAYFSMDISILIEIKKDCFDDNCIPNEIIIPNIISTFEK